MKTCCLLVLFLCWAGTAFGAEAGRDPEDLTRLLELGPEAEWHQAIMELVERKKGIPGRAVASILRRQSVLDPAERILLIKALQKKSLPRDPRIIRYFQQQATSPLSDAEVSKAAFQALLKVRSYDVIPVLESLRTQHPQWQEAIDKRLAYLATRQADELEAAQETAQEATQPAPEDTNTTAVLIVFAVLSCVLGLVLFIWAFRLLQLRRLLHGLSLVPIHSVAQGTTLLKGEVRAGSNALLVHPVTGEKCVYYPGAEREFPGYRFYLKDDSGQILVNPAGAVLLSEDGVLTAGEKVQILGAVTRQKASLGSGIGANLLAKPKPPQTLFNRVAHFLVAGVLGMWRQTDSARAMFSDPRRCFWIWDDLQKRPLDNNRDLIKLVLVFVLAGAWVTVFAAVVLSL